jgi:hypothetical protein
MPKTFLKGHFWRCRVRWQLRSFGKLFPKTNQVEQLLTHWTTIVCTNEVIITKYKMQWQRHSGSSFLFPFFPYFRQCSLEEVLFCTWQSEREFSSNLRFETQYHEEIQFWVKPTMRRSSFRQSPIIPTSRPIPAGWDPGTVLCQVAKGLALPPLPILDSTAENKDSTPWGAGQES